MDKEKEQPQQQQQPYGTSAFSRTRLSASRFTDPPHGEDNNYEAATRVLLVDNISSATAAVEGFSSGRDNDIPSGFVLAGPVGLGEVGVLQQHQQQQQQQQQPQEEAAAAGNAQRIPIKMLVGRKGNTEVRDGKICITTRSQMDPRWPEPQFIDETYTDRNRLDSLNLKILRPDMETRSHVKCLCTRVLSLRNDWYVHLHDGTVLCSACTRCFRCFRTCLAVGRKMNSIDGLVLCNTCMLSYGCYREPNVKIPLQPNFDIDVNGAEKPQRQQQQQKMQQQSQPQQQPPQQATSGHNAAKGIRRVWWTDCNASNSKGAPPADKPGAEVGPLEKLRYRDEGRRVLRKVYYPNPRSESYGRPNYQIQAPPYLGVDRLAGIQACPECNKQAQTQSLVVPGYARVYHERSFLCFNCKREMYRGLQAAGVHFESCNCHQPVVWCTSNACRKARLAHHAEKGCHLAPVHPGGRSMHDNPGLIPRFDFAAERKAQLEELARYNRLDFSWK